MENGEYIYNIERFMKNNRKVTSEEMALIAFLANKANYHLESDWKNHVAAYPLTKEKIGSIGLLDYMQEYTLKRSRVISCCKFYDTDNIEVAAYLLVDLKGMLYELDLWKVDNSNIHHIPSVNCMEDIQKI